MNTTDIVAYIGQAAPVDLDIIEDALKRRRKRAVARLARGQSIRWRDRDGTEWNGTVDKVNQKTVSLSETDHPRYTRGVRVPKEWVR